MRRTHSRVTDTPLQNRSVFTHEVRKISGKYRHQGELVIYVIDGKGYSVVDGERVDWEKGDLVLLPILVLLPMKPGGVEHQHFNLDPEKPALWMAFIHQGTREYGLGGDANRTVARLESARGSGGAMRARRARDAASCRTGADSRDWL
jgi:quercetin dioxygenase-like cupin family protein